MRTRPPRLANFSIRTECDGQVAVLAYDRPESGNSLHPTMLQGLSNAMKWATLEPRVKVIVQTGTGSFFTTGKHMKVGANDDPEELIRIFDEINRLIITCDKILIAAVNGPALGYGTTSLALYDLVYSVPHAYFTTPFSRWALCPEGCSSVTFPKIMGHHKAAALLLAGERMSAEELYTAGLITKIIEVPSDAEFIKKVLEIASRIASYPPVALRANKAVLSRARVPELLEANRAECEHLRERLNHQESKDAVKGFLAEQEQKRLAKVGKISKL